MAGKIKQLTFSDGANVSAPADFPTITTSGLVSYATDAAFVTGKGSAASAGDVYFDTTLHVVKEHNGTAWCVVLAANGLTASRALATDGSSIPVASVTTATELGYVSGVTSALQTQLNAKQATGNYITSLTSDVTASGPGAAAATVVSVGGSTAANVHNAELLANAATNANTASAIVKRDGSGNFSAGTITASLSGNASTATTATTASTVTTNANLTGPVTSVGNATAIADGALALAKLATTTAGFLVVGAATTGVPTYVALSGDATLSSLGALSIGASKITNSMLAGSIDLTAKVTGALPATNGGTGATSANAGLNALLPSQTSNSGKVLSTDGTNASWAAALTSTLSSAHLFVGNGSNVATDVAVSGDVSLANTGAFTLAATIASAKTWNDVQTWKYSGGTATAGSYDTSSSWTLGRSLGTNSPHVFNLASNSGSQALIKATAASAVFAPSIIADSGTTSAVALNSDSANNITALSFVNDFRLYSDTYAHVSGNSLYGTQVFDITAAGACQIGPALGAGLTAHTFNLKNNSGSQSAVRMSLLNGSAAIPMAIVDCGTTQAVGLSADSSNGFGALSFVSGFRFYSDTYAHVSAPTGYGSEVGEITSGGIWKNSATTWSSISDSRLKTNVVEVTSALDRICALRPVMFDWIEDNPSPLKPKGGFIAQEFSAVFPNLGVTEEYTYVKDGETQTLPDAHEINLGPELFAYLVGSIKELKTQNDALLARLTALENK